MRGDSKLVSVCWSELFERAEGIIRQQYTCDGSITSKPFWVLFRRCLFLCCTTCCCGVVRVPVKGGRIRRLLLLYRTLPLYLVGKLVFQAEMWLWLVVSVGGGVPCVVFVVAIFLLVVVFFDLICMHMICTLIKFRSELAD